jgi:hypothetical protein
MDPNRSVVCPPRSRSSATLSSATSRPNSWPTHSAWVSSARFGPRRWPSACSPQVCKSVSKTKVECWLGPRLLYSSGGIVIEDYHPAIASTQLLRNILRVTICRRLRAGSGAFLNASLASTWKWIQKQAASPLRQRTSSACGLSLHPLRARCFWSGAWS